MLFKEELMATVINFNQIAKDSQDKKSGVSRKPGSKKLYVDFRYNGVRIVKSTGLDDTPENEIKVQKWVDNQKEKIANGTFIFAKAFPGASTKEKAFHSRLEGWDYKLEPKDVLFADYVETWRQRFLANCRSAGKQRDFEQVITYWLQPHFGKKTFFQISGVAIKEFIQKLVWKTGEKKGQPLSASRMRNILIPLRAIWEDACEEHRWNLPDPFAHVKKHLPKRSKKHPEVFRFDEWIKVIENFDPYYRPVAETMIMTGMIGSEIAGLRKKDIRDEHIVIQNSIVRKHEKSDLKNDYRKRSLKITDALRHRLNQALSRSIGDYVFTMKSGRTFDVDSFRKNPWTSAFKRSGIPYKVPYATRHSFAAWALTLRMDPNKLVSLMGHSSKKMVYDVYGNYVKGLEEDAGKILGYFGRDFLGLKESTAQPFTNIYGESYGESEPGNNYK
jgi:integrase